MKNIREHFRLKTISLDHPHHVTFITSRFTNNRTFYLSWRLLWACYHIIWLITGLVMTSQNDDKSINKWLIYLSHWAYVLLVVRDVMDLMSVYITPRMVVYYDEDCESSCISTRQKLPWYLKLTWCLSSVVNTGSVMVTMWYWFSQGKGKSATPLRLHYHGINAAYVIMNVVISKMPIRLLHGLYPVIFGVLYTIFTAVYFFSGGTNQMGDSFIYKAVDWSKPVKTFVMTSISNFLFIPVVHICLWCFSLGVGTLCDKYLRKRHHTIEDLSTSNSEC